MSEFSELRHSFLNAVSEMLMRSTSMLFPDFRLSVEPASSIEHGLMRQIRMRVVDRAGPETALRDAVVALVRERAEAIVREAYAQACLKARSDAREVKERLRAATTAANVERVARNVLSRAPRTRAEPVKLDLDADLRSRP
jgi:hypothetical protein